MKKALLAAAAFVALPVMAQAQTLQYPGFYAGLEGGVNWMLNTTILNQSVSPNTGFAVGGVVGYDFVGPRVEAEVVYRNNQNNVSFGGTAINNQINQLGVLANVLYDFNAGGTIVPYIGAGAGIAFVDGNNSFGSTQFAYQGIIGVGYNITDTFRVNLDGRYYGTTNPQVSGNGFNNNNNFTSSWNNNNFSIMLGLQVKFGAPPVVVAPPPPPVTQAPSYMVFFDWDRSNLSAQALATIGQAANAYKTKGNARITATGHTDTSGPEAYNMALSLRRANTVKDALVRNGVPATAIAVIGRGEQGLLVQTADGVREPQNRRVEIVIQ
jgi:OmpA-OmpF porin, OOP family